MDKATARAAYKLKRTNLSIPEVERMDQQLFQQLQAFDWSGITYLHCYLSIAKFKEYDTMPFIEWIWENYPKIHIVISKSDFETHELKHYLMEKDAPLEHNPWGIPEPVNAPEIDVQQIDAVVAPLLVVDRAGNRIGYGKGFYDRFFAACRPDLRKLGISYFVPIDHIDGIQSWDIPISIVFTPEGTYELG